MGREKMLLLPVVLKVLGKSWPAHESFSPNGIGALYEHSEAWNHGPV